MKLRAIVFSLCLSLPAWAGIDPSDISADDSKTTAAELERLSSGLHDDSKRAATVKSMEELGPEATAAIGQRLAALRKEQDGEVWAVIQNVAAADPMHFNGEDFDLVQGLLAPQKRSGTPEYFTVLETAVWMRALAHIATTPAIRQIVIASDDHKGVLRNDAGRILRKLGEKAVAALWIAKGSSSSLIVRKWAGQELEAMGRRTAADAVQTKSNEILSDVLRAFGTTHDVDAVSVVLAFVNSDRVMVRTAARDAVFAYDKDALWKLREAYTNLVAHPAPEDWNAKRLATELFASYDRARLEDVYALLDAGLQKQHDGKISEAVQDYDKVLARQPLLDRRAEMASGYVIYGQSVEDTDRTAALAAYRKAARLDPEGARKGQIEGAIAYLEGEDLLARGVVDTTPFERALAADPGNAKAQAELDRLNAGAQDRQERLRRWSGIGIVVALGTALVVMFGGRRKRAAAV